LKDKGDNNLVKINNMKGEINRTDIIIETGETQKVETEDKKIKIIQLKEFIKKLQIIKINSILDNNKFNTMFNK
jgi:hypothetical protein